MELIGYRKGMSKKNRPYCVMYVVSDFTESEMAKGAVGSKVEDIFLPDDLVDMLKPSDLGKDVFCDYTVSNGRAFLNNVTVK